MKCVCLWMLADMVLLLTGYAAEDAVGCDVQDVSSTVNDASNRWTYISLSAHEMVGSSSLGDTHEDVLRVLRTDRDTIFHNGIIRTNSGSSGKGKGGITWTPVDYDGVNNLRASSYQTDTR